jgi:hypothetical protein
MSGKFNSYKQSLLDSSAPDLTSATVKAMLVSESTSGAMPSTHDFLNDVEAFRYVGTTDITLASKTIVNGTFDSANPTFTGVEIDGSKNVDIVILYVDTAGASNTDPLIAWYDEFTPVTPNGNNIEVQVNASGWFSV